MNWLRFFDNSPVRLSRFSARVRIDFAVSVICVNMPLPSGLVTMVSTFFRIDVEPVGGGVELLAEIARVIDEGFHLVGGIAQRGGEAVDIADDAVDLGRIDGIGDPVEAVEGLAELRGHRREVAGQLARILEEGVELGAVIAEHGGEFFDIVDRPRRSFRYRSRP